MNNRTLLKLRTRVTLVLIGTCCCVSVLTAWGQSSAAVEKVPLPPPPYFNPAPDRAAWVVQYPSANGEAPAPKRRTLKEIDVTKAGDVRHEISVFSDGSSAEIWYCKGIGLSKAPEANYAVAADSYTNVDSAQIDFPIFAWVAAKTFIGRTAKQGHTCYYYETTAVDAGHEEAWVDVTTGLPVAFTDADGERDYEFKPSDVSSLSLPPVYQAAYDRHMKELEGMKNFQQHFPR